VKIVNKRPSNLLNEIQNVFINGKQVKTTKITQIIPWFARSILRHKNYRQLTASRLPSTNGCFRLRPTRWRPESGSSWYKQV